MGAIIRNCRPTFLCRQTPRRHPPTQNLPRYSWPTQLLRLSGKPQYASVIAELHEQQSIALAFLNPDDGEDF